MEPTPAESKPSRKNKLDENKPDENEQDHHARIFEDPALREAVTEDPLFVFLKDHWREFLVVGIAVLAWFWGSSVYRSTYETSMKHAAETYDQIRSEYEVMVQQYREKDRILAEAAAQEQDASDADKTKPPVDPKQREEQLQSIESNIKTSSDRIRELASYLGGSYAPYNRIANLYSALAARLDGDFTQVQSLLSASSWKTEEPASRERYFSELGALVLARTLIDQPNNLEAGRDVLRALAEDGSFVNVSAALSYARTAEGSEQREAALQVLEGLVERHPEQANLLDDEISRLS